MGIRNSKIQIQDDFTGDNDVDNDVTDALHPEWLLSEEDVPSLEKQLKDLQNIPDKIGLFSLRDTIAVGKCTKVYDGDTAHFVVHSPFEPNKFIKFRCRMIGYNSPEMNSPIPETKKAAVKARDYLAKLILDKPVLLYFQNMDKYGRPLTDVYLIDLPLDFKNLFKTHVNKVMITKEHGLPYNP